MEVPRSAAVLLMYATPDLAPFALYMLRRPAQSRFAPGAYIFPGGLLEQQDRLLARDLLPTSDRATVAALHARLAVPGPFASPDLETTVALHVCALRELFEETGVLVARRAGGALVAHDQPDRWSRWREELLAGTRDFAAVLAEAACRLSLADLVYFSHWITPATMPRRFDTRFFLATLPPGQAASFYAGETAGEAWITPREALARHAAGRFPLLPVQVAHLERLAGFASVAAVLAFGRAKPVPAVLPVVQVDGRTVTLPEEVARCW